MIPGWGRSSGEGKCYPLQYSWASLVAQLVKNLPAVRETWIQLLGWEDLLEKGTATHSNILNCIVHGGYKESDTAEQLSLSLHSLHKHIAYIDIYTLIYIYSYTYV